MRVRGPKFEFDHRLTLLLLLLTCFLPWWADLVVASYLFLHNAVLLIKADFRVPGWVWITIVAEALFLWHSYHINVDLPGGFI